jgi:glycine hydroxymethyltransferase
VADLWDLIRAHEAWRREATINLQPSENVLSDATRALLATDLAGRYSLPGYESPWGDRGNAYRGTRYTDAIESLGESLAREVFSAAQATLKPLSGHLAGFLLLQASCRRGGRILILHPDHGGYEGYTPGFLPQYLGLEVGYLPFDPSAGNIDGRSSADMIRDVKPDLVLLGAIQILFPYPLGEVRAACDDVNAVLGYDASHVLGLVAGGVFQRPMVEGTDVLSASTHKSFPGPQGGVLLANRLDVFERAVAGITWHIEDNAHWNRIAATAHVLREMKAFGPAYADQVVRNAKALAAHLDQKGFPVQFRSHGYTESHQVVYDRSVLRDGWDLTPHAFADRLERNNLIVDAVGRLGTAEVTRWGAKEADMARIAELIVRAAHGEDVQRDVAEVRAPLRLAYVLEANDLAKGH